MDDDMRAAGTGGAGDDGAGAGVGVGVGGARRRSPFAMTGLVIGVLALGGALAHFWLGPIDPPPPLEEVVAEKAAAIKDRFVAKLKGEEADAAAVEETLAEEAVSDRDHRVRSVTSLLGFVALVLSVVGFVRREDLRVAGSAAALGGGAAAFQFLIVALGAILLTVLVAALLSGSG